MTATPDVMTREELQDFISKAPLYKKLRRPLPEFVNAINPAVVFIHCPNCRVERPFRNTNTRDYPTPLRSQLRTTGLPGGGGVHGNMSGIYPFHFLCSGCAGVEFYCWLEVSYEEMSVRKLGQSVPWSINITPELEKDLGSDASLYKKALTLMSQSYGIGACAYLRRMVENQINPLLRILYDMRQMDGAGADELREIESTISSKNFTPKIELASSLLPSSVVVAGENPVKLIHDQLSISLHALSEDEAMDVAVRMNAAFQYLLVELNRQQRSKKQFIESIRAIKS